jgi:hypothetical protein
MGGRRGDSQPQPMHSLFPYLTIVPGLRTGAIFPGARVPSTLFPGILQPSELDSQYSVA